MKTKRNLFIAFSLVILMLICPVIIYSCKSEAKPLELDLTDLAAVIGEKVDLSNTVDYADNIKDELGLTEDIVTQMVALKEGDVLSAEIIILIEAVDTDSAKSIVDKLKVYQTNKLNELRDYTINPDNERQYHIVEDAKILTNQNYVFWAVSAQNTEINGIINDYIKANS